VVQSLGKMMGMSTETTAQIFEDLNSAILILVIAYFLFKAVPKAFRNRTETIQKQLVDARSATEEANQRLSEVEARLARLGEDIEAIRQQTERDLVEDEKRIKQSLHDEKQRIVKSVEQEIQSAGASAQRQLKQFAADLAIDRAVKRIQLTAESDKAMVARFGDELAQKFGGGKIENGGRN
jgi:F-type H+-transporting ATPase subunit b